MKIELKRQKRKTIVLKLLDSENAVLKIPIGLSDKKVNAFLKEKENWLAKNAEKLRKAESFSDKFDLENKLYLNGQEFMDASELAIDFQRLPKTKRKKLIHKFYLEKFSQLESLAKDISVKTGLCYEEISPYNSVRVWGSFNCNGQMKLNWKLVLLPQSLVEYVICHELCHGLHMNHSSRFWQSVRKICPDFMKRKKELQNYAFVLRTSF